MQDYHSKGGESYESLGMEDYSKADEETPYKIQLADDSSLELDWNTSHISSPYVWNCTRSYSRNKSRELNYQVF